MNGVLTEIARANLSLDPEDLIEQKACVVPSEGVMQALEDAYMAGVEDQQREIRELRRRLDQAIHHNDVLLSRSPGPVQY